MSTRKPHRANSFSLSTPLNKVFTLTRHSSSSDLTADNFDTRSDIITSSFSFRRKASQAVSRVRKTVRNSAPSSRSKSLPRLLDKPLQRPVNKIEGVIVFSSINNGFCCNLLFTQTSIVFERILHTNDYKSDSTEQLQIPNVPRRTKIKNRVKNNDETEYINFLNIGHVKIDKNTSSATITIYMRNFKTLKIQIKCSNNDKNEYKNNHQMDKISSVNIGRNSSSSQRNNLLTNDVDKICKFFEDISEQNIWRETGRPMILEKDAINSRSFLWQYYSTKYSFETRNNFDDFLWAENEKIINFAQISSSLHLSKTQPLLIPALPGVKQFDLEEAGQYSADHRIPIVCYVYPKTKRILMRSTVFSYTDKISFIHGYINKSIEIRDIISKQIDVNDSYEKLKKSIFTVITYSQSNKNFLSTHWEIEKSKKFLTKCSGWFLSISNALHHSFDISKSLCNNQSIAIFEPFDCEWNCVISSLVQIILDPRYRTINGFDKLISKEWLYFPGFKWNEKSTKISPQNYIVRVPSSVMFNLFLDCVHQLIIQNPRSFEFSTSYLILLWDFVFQSQSDDNDLTSDFISFQAHIEMKNLLFNNNSNHSDDDVLLVDSHITRIQFFKALFFRQVRIDNFHFSLIETMQRSLLKKAQLI